MPVRIAVRVNADDPDHYLKAYRQAALQVAPFVPSRGSAILTHTHTRRSHGCCDELVYAFTFAVS